MKKKLINFSWPAYLSDFLQDTKQKNFSRGKLKVFYIGETADHRYFSKDFGKKLIASLPYTPIVSYYDEEQDDFVGHSTEQQIYGIVDPCIPPSFEKDEDGKEWCVCDVVLYTERPDQTGKLAQKIVGHPQSLELDPKTVKYTINYDERRHFKNVEFTDGTFIGVSVLGLNQKPAFTDSAFFSYNEQFEAKMNLLNNYCKQQNQEGDKEDMDWNDFMKLSWGDISVKVAQAIAKEYEQESFTQIIDMFDDCAIVRFCSYLDDSCKLMRVHYSCNEQGDIVLGDMKEVHITYEDIEEIGDKKDFSTEEISKEEISEDNTSKEEKSSEVEEKQDNEVDKFNVATDESETAEVGTEQIEDNVQFDNQNASEEVAQVTEKEERQDESIQEQESSSSTSFESERRELESLKKEKKVNILNSYKEYLSEEEYQNFQTNIDNFEEKDLELALLKKYKDYINTKPSQTMRAFAFCSPVKQQNAKLKLDDIVRKYL